MKTIFFISGIIFFYCYNIFSQDTIVKIDNSQINCKITEILTDEIKYIDNSRDIIMGIDKNAVSQVILSTGFIINFNQNQDIPVDFSLQKKKSIKFRILSPLYGYSDFIFENSKKPGSSTEYSVGLIGLGKKLYSANILGISLRMGYKFYKKPGYYLKGMKKKNILEGLYFKPEIATSFYKREYQYFFMSDLKKQVFSAALLLNIGDQWVFNDLFVIDLFMGIGYGLSSDKSFDRQFGFTTGTNEFPIAISSGFRIGFLLK